VTELSAEIIRAQMNEIADEVANLVMRRIDETLCPRDPLARHRAAIAAGCALAQLAASFLGNALGLSFEQSLKEAGDFLRAMHGVALAGSSEAPPVSPIPEGETE